MADALYNNKIELSAEPLEEGRIPRLNMVIGFICAKDNKIPEKIKSLKDHKGILIIEWLVSPSNSEMLILSEAWKSRIGDGADRVKHYSNGEIVSQN